MISRYKLIEGSLWKGTTQNTAQGLVMVSTFKLCMAEQLGLKWDLLHCYRNSN